MFTAARRSTSTMRVVLQRVSRAEVVVDGRTVGAIGRGVLLLVGLGHGDGETTLEKMADKLIGLRVFADAGGNTNLALGDVCGGVLAVSQFTLYADVRKGRRPSFTGAMPPAEASAAFDRFVAILRRKYTAGPVETGVFGAMMDVHLHNEGPVTIWLDSSDLGMG
jgi:D-tyrosyl-tRNA(Tyr) deacylase